MTRAELIKTDQKPPNPLFKGEGRLDGGREDRLLAETMTMAEDSNCTGRKISNASKTIIRPGIVR
jgi:hypothetical protein